MFIHNKKTSLVSYILLISFLFQNQISAFSINKKKTTTLAVITALTGGTYIASRLLIDFLSKQSDQEPIQLFGYDPNFQIEQNNTSNTIVLCGHGHKGPFSGQDTTYFEAIRGIPGNRAFFDFPETQKNIKGLFFDNFGQTMDAQVVLYALKKCHDAGYQTINIFVVSRASSATIHALYMLTDTTGKYTEQLALLGITENIRQELLNKINRGKIILNHPLLSLSDTIKSLFRNRLGIKLPTIIQPYGESFISSVAQTMLMVGTRYNPFSRKPIELLTELVQQNRLQNIHVVLVNNDNVVGNDLDERVQQLAQNYPQNLTVTTYNATNPAISHKDTSYIIPHARELFA